MANFANKSLLIGVYFAKEGLVERMLFAKDLVLLKLQNMVTEALGIR